MTSQWCPPELADWELVNPVLPLKAVVCGGSVVCIWKASFSLMFHQRLPPQICHPPALPSPGTHLPSPLSFSLDHATWDYPPLSSGCRNGACPNPLLIDPLSHVILALTPKAYSCE